LYTVFSACFERKNKRKENKMKYFMLSSFVEINHEKFEKLIEKSFGKKLVENYYTYVQPSYIYIAKNNEDYAGAIVVEKFLPGLFYLDKIAVTPDYRGNGVGKSLWSIIEANSEKLVWRSKPDNPINSFYLKECSGNEKFEGWNVFWKSMSDIEIHIAIDYALGKKLTLEAPNEKKLIPSIENHSMLLNLP